MDYTAQGHTVGVAQRMESIAAPNCAVLSGATAQRVEGYFALRSLGSASVKGVREPVAVFELEGLGTARTRLDVSRARGFAKFVGRGDELAALDAALARAEAGQGQVLGIVAEAGAGKSRLCQEFAERCRARGVQVRAAHGVAHGKAVPLFPILSFYRQALGLEERDEPALARQKVAGALAQLDPQLLEALPLLCEFLGVPDPQGRPAGVAGPERERRLLGLLKRVMQARSARQTAVLIFEDLHWFDPASERILAGLAETVDGTRTLLVVNFRPEFRADWMGRTSYRQLALAPLGPEALAELLASLLGQHASLAGLAERIRAHTGGNPYFVEEVVRTLVEAGALEGSAGHYVLARPVAALAIPPSVQAVLAARIDRLAERAKHVLQAAAVIGREFSEPLLRQGVELPESEVADALRALVQAEFLFETALYPDLEYAFKHPLTREVAYDAQLRARRGRTHLALARALIERHGGEAGEQAALIAEHLEQGGEAREAAHWHARAGAWANRRNAEVGLGHWRRVRELLKGERGGEELRLAADAEAQIVVSSARSDFSGAEFDAVCEEALALAGRSDDARLEALACAARCLRAVYLPSDSALEDRRRLLAAAERSGDRRLRVVAAAVANTAPTDELVSTSLRRIEEAIPLAAGDLLLGADLIGWSPGVLLHAQRAVQLARLGRFPDAEAARERAEQLARELGDPMTEAVANMTGGFVAFLAQDAAEIVSNSRCALEALGRIDHPIAWALRRAMLLRGSTGHALGGDPELASAGIDEAEALLPEALRGGDDFLRCEALAHTHLARGEAALALEHAEACLRLASFPLAEGNGRILRARARIRAEGAAGAAAAQDDLERAEACFARQQATGFAGRIAEVRAEVAAALGDEAERLRRLREAKRVYEEMGLPKQAQALAAALGE
jgi:hypothetical protein